MYHKIFKCSEKYTNSIHLLLFLICISSCAVSILDTYKKNHFHVGFRKTIRNSLDIVLNFYHIEYFFYTKLSYEVLSLCIIIIIVRDNFITKCKNKKVYNDCRCSLFYDEKLSCSNADDMIQFLCKKILFGLHKIN